MPAIKRSPLTTEVSAYLRERISQGVWQVGSKIPSENVLSRELGVSRTTLRQVIGRFIALGILKTRQGQGCFLVRNDTDRLMGTLDENELDKSDDIEKVLRFRLMLEPEAAALAADLPEGRRLKLLKKLRGFLAAMQGSLESAENFVRADMDFHRAISEAVNDIAGRVIDAVLSKTMSEHQGINRLVGFSGGLEYHSSITTAIEAGDADEARELMREHLSSSLEQILAQSASKGERAPEPAKP